LRIGGGGSLQWQDVEPPIHDAVGFREETVTSDVDTIAAVVYGSGQTSQIRALFEDERLDIGACEKFVSGRQPGRPSTNDDGSFSLGRQNTRSMNASIKNDGVRTSRRAEAAELPERANWARARRLSQLSW